MFIKLKKLVQELETTLNERGGSLDASAKKQFEARIEALKEALDEEDATKLERLRVDALLLMANLLSAITNVMTLLK